MSRIQKTFAGLQSQKKKALITFITAGDPAPELTVPLLHALVESGADILELGVPFSDPMAEGPVIQRANERALKFNVGMHDVLDYVREFRKNDQHTPVVLMGYANPIEAMGLELLVAEHERLPQLNAIKVPAGVDEALVRKRLLADYNLEIGAGLGALAGKVWRIGLMGASSTPNHVTLCLAALEAVLPSAGVKIKTGVAGAAARAVLFPN